MFAIDTNPKPLARARIRPFFRPHKEKSVARTRIRPFSRPRKEKSVARTRKQGVWCRWVAAGRCRLTSLRMLCARRKGFATKSLVPPLFQHPPVWTPRPSFEMPPSRMSASADADQPFLRHSHLLRSYSPPPPCCHPSPPLLCAFCYDYRVLLQKMFKFV